MNVTAVILDCAWGRRPDSAHLMHIEVEQDDWGNASLDNIRRLLEDVAGQLPLCATAGWSNTGSAPTKRTCSYHVVSQVAGRRLHHRAYHPRFFLVPIRLPVRT
jgi:hypothetical protein